MLLIRDILLILSIDLVYSGACPKDPSSISPCTCDGDSIKCIQVTSLDRIFQQIAIEHPNDLWNNFELNSGTIKTLKAGTFSGIRFRNIKLIDCDKLDCISPQAFAGMADITESFTAIKTNLSLLNSDCDVFKALVYLTHLNRINITYSNIKAIPKEAFKGIGQQQNLNIIEFGTMDGVVGGQITRVGSVAFSDLKALQYIGLSGHLISTVESNAFEFIDRSNNKLTINLENNKLSPKTFESGAFDVNGRLTTLKLGLNSGLKVLDQRVFQSLLVNRNTNYDINLENKIDLIRSPIEVRIENQWLVGSLYVPMHLKDKLTNILDPIGQSFWNHLNDDFNTTTTKPASTVVPTTKSASTDVPTTKPASTVVPTTTSDTSTTQLQSTTIVTTSGSLTTNRITSVVPNTTTIKPTTTRKTTVI